MLKPIRPDRRHKEKDIDTEPATKGIVTAKVIAGIPAADLTTTPMPTV